MASQIELVALSLESAWNGNDGHSRYAGQVKKEDCNLTWLEITKCNSTKSVWGLKQDQSTSARNQGFRNSMVEVPGSSDNSTLTEGIWLQ